MAHFAVALYKRNYPRRFTRWKGILWRIGLPVYSLTVVIYYVGVMLAMLMAGDATLQNFSSFSETQKINLGLVSVSRNTAEYLTMAAFMLVAIAQTLIVGAPMARWIITKLDASLALNDPMDRSRLVKPGPATE